MEARRGRERSDEAGGEKERRHEGERGLGRAGGGFRAEVVHQGSPAAGGTMERKVVSILCNVERRESARIRRGSAPTSLGYPGGDPLSLEFGATLLDRRQKSKKKYGDP